MPSSPANESPESAATETVQSPSPLTRHEIVPLRWCSGKLMILDQLQLPHQEHWIPCTTAQEVADSIVCMNVRGAPAIGVAAAFGVVLGLAAVEGNPTREDFERIRALLAATRPTAVNLFWALDRMERLFGQLLEGRDTAQGLISSMEAEACAIMQADAEACRRIGSYGAPLLPSPARILTHCNAGALATAAYGTALGIIRAAHEAGSVSMVFVDETRPYLQGARLTSWELHRERIPCTLICDNMAGSLMDRGEIDVVIVGADRIAANGDVANKIGTYPLAVLCRHHGLPFYVAAPVSTIDATIDHGDDIPIEHRSSEEVTRVGNTAIAPDGVKALHPAFDVTPAELVTAIVTNRGVLRPPYRMAITKVLS